MIVLVEVGALNEKPDALRQHQSMSKIGAPRENGELLATIARENILQPKCALDDWPQPTEHVITHRVPP